MLSEIIQKQKNKNWGSRGQGRLDKRGMGFDQSKQWACIEISHQTH
jgi:hypothetical protein